MASSGTNTRGELLGCFQRVAARELTPSLRSPGRCTTKLATRCVTRPATAAPGAARLTRKRGQGDLSGEQFDKLYRFYREVYAKVPLGMGADPVSTCAETCPNAHTGHGGRHRGA